MHRNCEWHHSHRKHHKILEFYSAWSCDEVVMCEKIFRQWDVFCLTISPVMFGLERYTIAGVVKCGGRANCEW